MSVDLSRAKSFALRLAALAAPIAIFVAAAAPKISW
jgi:hypothetical protein